MARLLYIVALAVLYYARYMACSSLQGSIEDYSSHKYKDYSLEIHACIVPLYEGCIYTSVA